MKVILTGTTGFIGRNLVKRFLQDKHELILMSRGDPLLSEAAIVDSDKIQVIKYDLRENDSNITRQIKDADVLVHVAAYVPRSKRASDESPMESINVNINGTLNLLQIVGSIVRKIVYISTLEVYGTPISSPITESHQTFPTTYYGISKLAAESYVKMFCERSGLTSVVLRLSTVYGPGEPYERAIPNFIKKVCQGERPVINGIGSDLRDFLYIDDASDGIANATNKVCQGTYNIASGQSYSIRDIAERIIKISQKDLKPEFKPSNHKVTNFVFDISKAKNDLEFLPKTSIVEGLRREISYYENQQQNNFR